VPFPITEEGRKRIGEERGKNKGDGALRREYPSEIDATKNGKICKKKGGCGREDILKPRKQPACSLPRQEGEELEKDDDRGWNGLGSRVGQTLSRSFSSQGPKTTKKDRKLLGKIEREELMGGNW